MRILSISGQNIASLAQPFSVDFTTEPLAGAGLFAITGETGAGKSSILDAMCLAAESGMKEIVRLDQARQIMERKLRGRRSTSSLPAAIELILSRPIVSAAMVAKAANVTPRGALNLIAELGVREMTGRGSYRAWGIL